MGGRDHPDIDAHRCLSADAVELALGEHPQQPCLQRRRHVADLIEEQRAAIRLLEATSPLCIGAGEGALLVAEELRLQQLRGYRRGVERDERSCCAWAMVVQRPCDQFLAGARLAGDQHRRSRTRQSADRAEHLLHRGRFAEQVRGATVADRHRIRAPYALRRTTHQIDDLVDIERLGQILERTAFVGGDRIVEVSVRGHDDDRQLWARTVDAPQQFETGLSRHADVGDQHIRRVAAQGLERGFGGFEDPRRHPAALQRALEHPTDRGIVVDQPDPKRRRAHASATGGVSTPPATTPEGPPSGSRTLNTVRPGSLSNSMRPPLRVTISCATAKPSPVPLARPVTSG